MSGPVVIASYFTPRVSWTLAKKRLHKNEIPDTAKVSGTVYAEAACFSCYFPLEIGIHEWVVTEAKITCEVTEWFEIQYRSDGRFYSINDKGDEKKLRTASFMGCPNHLNIGGIQFPNKVFSYSAAIFDRNMFHAFVSHPSGDLFVDIKYHAPSGDFRLAETLEPWKKLLNH